MEKVIRGLQGQWREAPCVGRDVGDYHTLEALKAANREAEKQKGGKRTIPRFLRGITLAGLASLAVVGCRPQLQEVRDVNRDGVADIFVKGSFGDTYLFLSQRDGGYLRLDQIENSFYDKANDEYYFKDAINGEIKKARKLSQ